MTLLREVRRLSRRAANAARRVALFLGLPAIMGLDCVEGVLSALGVAERLALLVTQRAAVTWLVIGLCLLGWTFHVYPVTPPNSLVATEPIVIEIRYTFSSLAWAAAQCSGALCLVLAVSCHRVLATTVTCMVVWPKSVFAWLGLCLLCSWLDDEANE